MLWCIPETMRMPFGSQLNVCLSTEGVQGSFSWWIIKHLWCDRKAVVSNGRWDMGFTGDRRGWCCACSSPESIENVFSSLALSRQIWFLFNLQPVISFILDKQIILVQLAFMLNVPLNVSKRNCTRCMDRWMDVFHSFWMSLCRNCVFFIF